jgi:hypothetical protein
VRKKSTSVWGLHVALGPDKGRGEQTVMRDVTVLDSLVRQEQVSPVVDDEAGAAAAATVTVVEEEEAEGV